MIGSIIGDVIGSVYEAHPIKKKNFPLYNKKATFTDDTVLTIATAYAIMQKEDYGKAYKYFGRKYPKSGFGGSFFQWLWEPSTEPYGSWGNGAAMRVSPIGYAFSDEDEVLRQAQRSAGVSHNHPEGIKGAQAVALAVYYALHHYSKEEIRNEISSKFGYNLNRTVDTIRPSYTFDVSCQGSVPEAIISFLDSDDCIDAIRTAISLGGDSDTLACIAGGIAYAYFGTIEKEVENYTKSKLPEEFVGIIENFSKEYM